jgi:flagellar hook-length control protein FliK
MPLPPTAPITPAAVSPAAPPPSTGNSDDTSFARMLCAERSASAEEARDTERAQAGRHAARDTKARGEATPDDRPATDEHASQALSTDADRQRAADRHDDPVVADSALAGWLAALHPGHPAAADGTAADVAIGAHDTGKAAKAEGLQPEAAPRRGGLPAAARADKDERDAGRKTGVALQAEETTQGEERAVAIEAKTAPAARFELPRLVEAPTVHGGAHTVARAEPGAAPVAVDVPAPVGAPEFREALGVQVSVLARDGVQHAELHLNPADMGPVSVQIALDGNRAQVDFGAASAATRQAIEAGLPELAAALRDAGFTLAGGGVSQHAGGQSSARDADERSGGAAGRASRIEGGTDAAAPRRASVRMSQGAVDLYA